MPVSTEITQIELVIRLLLAGILGAAVGLEREFRAKEAGIRTHFLVTLGSALIMIVSQWGFQSVPGIVGLRPADAARVAAQIVSGIGFLGAGAIIMQKQSVRGLTTAAGLWVAAGVGMAVGSGLYLMGIATTILMLIGLELFRIIRNVKSRYITLVFKARSREDLTALAHSFNEHGHKILDCNVTHESADGSKFLHVKMHVNTHPGVDEGTLLISLQQLSGVTIEDIH